MSASETCMTKFINPNEMHEVASRSQCVTPRENAEPIKVIKTFPSQIVTQVLDLQQSDGFDRANDLNTYGSANLEGPEAGTLPTMAENTQINTRKHSIQEGFASLNFNSRAFRNKESAGHAAVSFQEDGSKSANSEAEA